MLKIAICDNDDKELELLRKIIVKIMEEYTISFEITGYEQGEELLESELEFQLVFLDIILDGKNGIDVGNEIYRRNHRIKIIFQTNYRNFYKEAINSSHAFAYLEKPLTEDVVKKQIEEFMMGDEEAKESQVEFRKVTVIKNGNREERQRVRLQVNEIIYFEYLKAQKRIRVITESGEYIYKDTMSNLENRMRPFGFAVSCRGILVNIENVIRIEGYSLIMNNGEKIALSQRRVIEFKAKMNSYIHSSWN